MMIPSHYTITKFLQVSGFQKGFGFVEFLPTPVGLAAALDATSVIERGDNFYSVKIYLSENCRKSIESNRIIAAKRLLILTQLAKQQCRK